MLKQNSIGKFISPKKFIYFVLVLIQFYLKLLLKLTSNQSKTKP